MWDRRFRVSISCEVETRDNRSLGGVPQPCVPRRLPSSVSAQVRNLATARRVSANRIPLELIENGFETENRRQQEFFDLAERFRAATDPDEVRQLGDQLGRMVFGG